MHQNHKNKQLNSRLYENLNYYNFFNYNFQNTYFNCQTSGQFYYNCNKWCFNKYTKLMVQDIHMIGYFQQFDPKIVGGGG